MVNYLYITEKEKLYLMLYRTFAGFLFIIFLMSFWVPPLFWILKKFKTKLFKHYKYYFHYLKIYAGVFITGKKYHYKTDSFI